MKMLWDKPDYHSELLRLRRRVSELENDLANAKAEYRSACDQLADELTELRGFIDHGVQELADLRQIAQWEAQS